MAAKSKKETIHKAAKKLFSQFGIKKVTVEEICREAQTSKMTFYRHFPNKTELVIEILSRITQEATHWFEGVMQSEMTTFEKIQAFIEEDTRISEELGQAFVFDYLDDAEIVRKVLEDMHRKAFEIFEAFVEEGKAKGVIRKEVKPAFVMQMWGKLIEMIHDPDFRGLFSDQKEMVQELNTFLFYGLMKPQKKEK